MKPDKKDFEDCFSKHAELYARVRPRYPDELFQFLASQAPGKTLAWDSATGNGQAALSLVKYFEHVVATDASAQQLENAYSDPRITYRAAKAEESGLEDSSVDLITVAQALHWFDLEFFYHEVKRVLKPKGVLAAWSYRLPLFAPEIDELCRVLFEEIVQPYWSPKVKYVEEEYKTIPFPFEEIKAPAFAARVEWRLSDLLGYLESWSAVQKFMEVRGFNPIQEISADLSNHWGDAARVRNGHLPLYLRVGRV
jgi:ubiquinone/menaquinone biosynthesis C-methylase UbiE